MLNVTRLATSLHRLPAEAQSTALMAGLRTWQAPYSPDFPALAPVSSQAFVPAHRCGAVPDSRRIPFSLRHNPEHHEYAYTILRRII